jgi:hypothetical protein
MAEWFKRGTVNTFYRGSNPLKALCYYNIKYGLQNLNQYFIPLSLGVFS